MIEVNERPLISFCLLSFNQEKYIRDAMAGAFAQTYSPLEIICSDDCSPDHTFEIMKEMAAAYRGPHKIILNKNAVNTGVGAHINRIVELSSGQLLVLAAGDDISRPERAQCLCDEWLRLDGLPTSIHSDFDVIDDNGSQTADELIRHPFAAPRSASVDEICDYLRGDHPVSNFLGATHAVNRTLFERFGPLNPDVFLEDVVIGFRSLLHGSFAYVPRKLVQYRVHDNNLSVRSTNRHISRIERVRRKITHSAVKNHFWMAVMNNYHDDVARALKQGDLTHSEGTVLFGEIDRCIRIKRCEYSIDSRPPVNGLKALFFLAAMRPRWSVGWSAMKHWVFRTADYIRILPR